MNQELYRKQRNNTIKVSSSLKQPERDAHTEGAEPLIKIPHPC